MSAKPRGSPFDVLGLLGRQVSAPPDVVHTVGISPDNEGNWHAMAGDRIEAELVPTAHNLSVKGNENDFPAVLASTQGDDRVAWVGYRNHVW